MDGTINVGIDVSKHWLDVVVGAGATPQRFDNTDPGHDALIKAIETLTIERIVLEATGGLERPVVVALAAAGLPVVVVNALHVRNFARATGRLAKTDAIDAEVLTQFAKAVAPEVRPIASAEHHAFK